MVRPGPSNFGICRTAGRMLSFGLCLATCVGVAPAADLGGGRDLALKIGRHLDAGEFGPALTLAMAATSEEDRTSLIKDVAQAQQAAGETAAASGTLRRVPSREARAQAQGQLAQKGLAGGGAQYGVLMNLIQQNTNGKWENIDGEGGAMTPFQTGVKVSPNGLLHRLTSQELSGELSALGLKARQADLNEEVARKSGLRMVSLTRLEKAVARRIEEGKNVPETMQQMAGLTQVQYVFVYPEANEIVIAGPADGWQYDKRGQTVSVTEGRPTIQLDDLVTVLRTFANGGAEFGCSINTRDQGVKALMEYAEASQKSGPLQPGTTKAWTKELEKKLGRQDVVVWGVPADSRVARVIVEADYRMKLIGIDRLNMGKEFPSYFDLLPAAQQKDVQQMDALRWWLSLKFDGVSHSEEKTAFEIHGSSVLCQSENQMLTEEGKHVPTGQSEATNRLFAQNFTDNYATLANRDVVFADTRNVFDLALCAALIKNEGMTEKANWNYGVFAPGGAYEPAKYAVPKEVDSVVNHRIYRGGHVVVQVAGGVTANVMAVAQDPAMNTTEPQLESVGRNAKAPELPVGRWWWDSAK